jgi:hypothetical protein
VVVLVLPPFDVGRRVVVETAWALRLSRCWPGCFHCSYSFHEAPELEEFTVGNIAGIVSGVAACSDVDPHAVLHTAL